MKVACIGSRDLTSEQLQLCQEIGRLIALNGFELHSGNAPGADQAYAWGANQVNPELVHLHLPWAGFKREAVWRGNHVYVYPFDGMAFYVDVASECHPKWSYLRDYAKKLHARNVSILMPGRQKVDVCVAWPSQKVGGGGTGQGMRIAEAHDIRLLDLTKLPAQQVISWLQDLKR